MARIFEPNVEVVSDIYEQPQQPKSRFPGLTFAIVFAIIISIILMFVIVEKKREIVKDKKMIQLIEVLVMKKGFVLAQKVKYETSKKVDPEDTSDIFYEVVNGNEEYSNGTLIKFPHRFINETQIEGKTYSVIDTEQIYFHINKEDVKENLLKR